MFKKIQRIHFVGIGGIGMSGIAELLLNLGYEVSGSDLRSGPITSRLASMGGRIVTGHDAENVAGANVVVVSSAVRPDNVEVAEAHRRQVPVIPRGEMLAELTRLKYSVAVAGAHGKTSTASMIATVLLRAGLDPTAVIGGRLNTLGSNAKLGTGDFIVVESDESDGSFLKLNPTVAVVTNIDREHLDHYRDLEEIRDAFAAFINKVPFYGAAILCRDDPGVQSILPRVRRRIITYGTGSRADLLASRVECRGFGSAFEVRAHGDSLGAIRLQIPGEHSVLNAMAAVAAGLELDVAFSTIAAALEDFQNADRRFQIRGEVRGILIVDDYGHHPTEVTATLSAARRSCDRRIVALFQPHRFTRTAALEQDFACCFSQADALIVLPIYPAGEEPIPGVTAERLVALIEATGHRDAAYAPDFAAAEGMLSRKLRPGDLLLTLGAGDVWKVGERLMRQWADAPESHA